MRASPGGAPAHEQDSRLTFWRTHPDTIDAGDPTGLPLKNNGRSDRLFDML
jgi:hypothetical protein